MSVSVSFSTFLDNLKISNRETIGLRYGEVTRALNKHFRDTESTTANSLQVGSFGRGTGINGISDLDILYIMPKGKWDSYGQSKQLKLLQDAKSAIKARYPKTEVRVDRLVVTVHYRDFHIEVQPVFGQPDGSYLYPDTKGDGSWRITKPHLEMVAIAELDDKKNSNLRPLCKMARAWKNRHGVKIGGLLIDTLAYNYLATTHDHDATTLRAYGELSRDFFAFLAALPSQDRYNAPGSNQHVRVRAPFQRKAKAAYSIASAAADETSEAKANQKWRELYGRDFPIAAQEIQEAQVAQAGGWRNTEQFIEDEHSIDIRYDLTIDCKVTQDGGFRENRLRAMIAKRIPLLAKRSLEFFVANSNIPGDYSIKWKVLNRGPEARARDQIRGQIVEDEGWRKKREPSKFKGPHLVECYAIQSGVVVARDRIEVPISTTG